MKTPRGRTELEWLAAFIPVRRNDFDLMHSVNSVRATMRRPFVLSFEDYCPRVPDDRYNAHLEWAMARRLRGKTGWLLDLPNDPVVGRGQWVGKGGAPGCDDAFESAVSTLTDGLVDTILRHVDSPVENYEQMSAAARSDVRRRMSTEVI